MKSNYSGHSGSRVIGNSNEQDDESNGMTKVKNLSQPPLPSIEKNEMDQKPSSRRTRVRSRLRK